MNIARYPGALIAATLLAGCAGARVGLGSSAPPSLRGVAPAPGTAYTSAAVSADVGANPYVGLLFFGAFAAAVADQDPMWGDGPGRRVPPLAEDRAIAERDCTRPMELPSANLRCK